MSNRARPTAPSTWTDGTTESSSPGPSSADNGSGPPRQQRPPVSVSRPPAGRPTYPPATAPGPGAPSGSSANRLTAAKQAVQETAPIRQREVPRKAATPSPRISTGPRTRKARLRLARIDPWSVMKTAFLLAIAFGIVTWIAVFIVWSAIGAAGVFDNINRTVSEVLGTPAAEPFRIEDYVGTNKVMGFTTLIACADVLILTALATLGAFLYNLAASLLGGLEVTLASED